MRIHKFYAWYANLPLSERTQQIGMFEDTPLTPDRVYKRLSELDNITRPYDIERDELLSKVEWWKIKKEEKQ